MRFFTIVVLTFIASCNSHFQKQVLAKDSTQLVIVEQGDNEMEAAITEARSTLKTFDFALLSTNANYIQFAIKARFAYGVNNGEHIWLNQISKVDRGYVGIVNNVPEYIDKLHFGDTVKISIKDISDWMYYDKDTLKGGFTIKLIRERMTPAEKAAFDSTVGSKN